MVSECAIRAAKSIWDSYMIDAGENVEFVEMAAPIIERAIRRAIGEAHRDTADTILSQHPSWVLHGRAGGWVMYDTIECEDGGYLSKLGRGETADAACRAALETLRGPVLRCDEPGVWPLEKTDGK